MRDSGGQATWSSSHLLGETFAGGTEPTLPSAAGASLPPPGSVIGGNFEVVRTLGVGGMGAVMLARDTHLGRLVAVKLVRPDRLTSTGRERFEAEAKRTAQLAHPHIVTVYQFGLWQEHPFLVLELLKGRTLAEMLRGWPIGPTDAVRYALQVLDALGHAHARGVIHRDIKPDNVFVQDDGVLKVLDFGLAALTSGTTPESPRAGTPGYMAPEQWAGAAQSARTDIFAVGALLHRMATGRLPFDPGELAQDGDELDRGALDGMPDALAATIARALRRGPDERFDSAEAMAAALSQGSETGANVLHDGTPYRYLESFSEQDAAWFFGRGPQISRAVVMLERRPLIAVIGPSGAGKSSLMRAGVVPRLRERGRWTVLSCTPGRRPLRGLVSALATEATTGQPAALSAEQLSATPQALGMNLRALAADRDTNVLLLIDQFEELYTHCDDETQRRRFAEAVLGAADDGAGAVRVAITLRGDFLHRVTEHAELGDLVTANAFPLAPPGRDAMLEALAEPARRCGYALEPGLAEEMVDLLGRATAPLPLLQFAASRMWEQRDRDKQQLTRAALEALGGVHGVLAAHADGVLDALAGPADRAVARLLLTELVAANGTRRRRQVQALTAAMPDPEVGSRVLDHLIRGRLITAGRDEDGRHVQIAHEALVMTWQRLADWLRSDSDARAHRERVEQAAALWRDRGEQAGLLWQGDVLDEALAWRRRSHALGALADRFLSASDAARARGVRRRRWAIVALIVALAGIAVASWMTTLRLQTQERAARDAEQSAVQSAQTAEERRLDAQASTLMARAETRKLRGERTEALVLARASLALTADPVLRLQRTAEVDRLVSRGGIGATLVTHTADVETVRFGPSGKLLLVGASDGPVWLVDAETRQIIARPPSHSGIVLGLAFDPRGHWIATGGSDKRLLISGIDGALRHTVPFKGRVRRIEPSPDGRLVAASASSGDVLVVSAGSGEIVHSLSVALGARSLVFTADGTRLAASTDDGAIAVWQLATGRRIARWRQHDSVVSRLALFDGDRMLASASWDGAVTVRPLTPPDEAASGDPAHQVVAKVGTRLWDVAVAPDETALVTAGDDGRVRVYDWPAAGLRYSFQAGTSGVRQVRFVAATAVAASSFDNNVTVWDITTGARLERFVGGGGQITWNMDAAAGRVATAAADGTARLWPLRAGNRLFTFPPREGRNQIFGGSPSSQRLLMGGHDNEAELWTFDGRRVARLVGHQSMIWAGGWSPDGRVVATGSLEPVLRLWDGRTGAPMGTIETRVGPRAVTFSPDGRRLAITHLTGEAAMYDRATGRRLFELRGLTPGAHHGRFSDDGRHVVGVGSQASVVFWNAETGDHRATLHAHTPRPRMGAFRPGSATLYTAGDDAQIGVFDAERGVRLPDLSGHTAGVHSLRFSHDGRLLASSSDDATVRIWDLNAGRPPVVLQGHTRPVRDARWVPGRPDRMLSLAVDGTMRVWDAHSAALLRTMAGPALSERGLWFDPTVTRVAASSVVNRGGVWRLPDLDAKVDPLERSGRLTNLRVCRSGPIVGVLPPPAPSTHFAPPALCPRAAAASSP